MLLYVPLLYKQLFSPDGGLRGSVEGGGLSGVSGGPPSVGGALVHTSIIHGGAGATSAASPQEPTYVNL